MSISPLKSPRYQRSQRRGNGPSMAGLVLAALALVLALWLAWRFGFGLPAQVSRAVKMAQSGEPEKALQRLSPLAEAHPENARTLDGLGLALNRAGQPAQAQDAYERGRDAGLGARAADLHVKEGRAAMARGAWDSASVEFEHAASLDKRSAKALAGQAGVALVRGQVAASRELYKAALVLNPGLKEARDGEAKAGEALERGSLYYMYDRNGEPLARQAVGDAGLGERSYPQSQLTSHVVGYFSQRAGDAGLERDLKDLFPGTEVELTLDLRLQQAASKAMGWRKGALVAINPATGEILAALSQPAFRPAEVDKEWYNIRANPNRPLLNRAFDGLYEPGSIAKIITAAGALEAHVDMAKLFPFSPPTSIIIEGQIFRDWADHGRVRSLKEAMDVSSNIAMYRVGKALGGDALLRMTNRFGFNKPVDLSFSLDNGRRFEPQASTPRASHHPDTDFALAERSCGLGKDLRVSPLHAARMAAVVASKGRLMKPRLVRAVRSLSGETLYSMQPELEETVYSEALGEKVMQLMEDAVEGERGIGKRARVEGFRVAGKTGTARTNRKGQLDAWFIAYAPADKPRIAVAVFCDQEGTGMHVAAPIAGAFLREALR